MILCSKQFRQHQVYNAANFTGTPVAEGFVSNAFPPAKWGFMNANNGPSWSKFNGAGGFALTNNSAKYDFYYNSVVGDADDLYPASNGSVVWHYHTIIDI